MKLWWTADQLAEERLEDLWAGASGVHAQAMRQGWKMRPHPRRKNVFQCSVYSLPEAARRELERFYGSAPMSDCTDPWLDLCGLMRGLDLSEGLPRLRPEQVEIFDYLVAEVRRALVP